LVLILLLVGCTHTAYVRGVAGPAEPARVATDAPICVAVAPDAPEWPENDDIQRKIDMLVVEKGFTTTTSDKAVYYLFFEFNRKSMMTRVRYEWFEGMQSGMHTTRQEGPFDLTLGLKLIEKSAYDADRMEEFVWVGGAVLAEVPTESPKFVDMLLVAALRPFPIDTGKIVKAKIGLYDKNAKRLRKK
jgi:hypothetical protein